jgi:hypothetical protein
VLELGRGEERRERRVHAIENRLDPAVQALLVGLPSQQGLIERHHILPGGHRPLAELWPVKDHVQHAPHRVGGGGGRQHAQPVCDFRGVGEACQGRHIDVGDKRCEHALGVGARQGKDYGMHHAVNPPPLSLAMLPLRVLSVIVRVGPP